MTHGMAFYVFYWSNHGRMNGQYLVVGQAFVFSNGVYTDMVDIFIFEWLDGDVDWKDKQHWFETKEGKK
jgi:hypothetical protein